MDERRADAERELFASSRPGSSRETTGGRGVVLGISLWLVAAVSLVIGIVIGFASGYTAGQRDITSVSEAPDSRPDEPRPAPSTAAPERAAVGRPFTEGAVTDPADREERRQGVPEDRVRVDPEPIVAAPEPPPPGVEPPAAARAAPASTGTPAGRSPGARRTAPVDPVASGPGSLQILSRPSGAQVFVDGRVVGRTPMVIPDVRSGEHEVRLELTGFRRWATSVQVTPGTRARVAASLEQ